MNLFALRFCTFWKRWDVSIKSQLCSRCNPWLAQMESKGGKKVSKDWRVFQKKNVRLNKRLKICKTSNFWHVLNELMKNNKREERTDCFFQLYLYASTTSFDSAIISPTKHLSILCGITERQNPLKLWGQWNGISINFPCQKFKSLENCSSDW